MDLLHLSRPRHPPNASPLILPEELIAEVLSFLPVKSLMQLRSVCKSWKSLISNPTFIKLHLYRSSRKTDLTLVSSTDPLGNKVLSFTICRLFENPPIIINLPNNDPYYQLNDKGCVLGSCNGLLCLVGTDDKMDMWIRFWNPATRTISGKLGGDCPRNCIGIKFAFGYDNSSDTYKVVNFFVDTTIVKVFILGHNVWRNIPNSPVAMYRWMKVVHLNGSVFWVSIRNYNGEYRNYDCKIITIEQFLIISLDLGTEKYTQLLPPQGFDKVPFLMPNLSVLEDCLCFSHDFEQTHFVIWQMKGFRGEESWTRFLKISYNNLQIYGFKDLSLHWLPLCVSEKSGTLLLTNYQEGQAILYNWRDNRVERTNEHWLGNCREYVESLVSY